MPRTRFLADVPISVYRQAPELPPDDGERPSLASRLIAQDLAHRRDMRVTESEIGGGLQTFATERQYIVRKDEIYTVRDPQPIGPMGAESLASESLGEQPVDRLPIARTGSNAAPGLLIRDDETGEFFDVDGITLMSDNKRQVIHCSARSGGNV